MYENIDGRNKYGRHTITVTLTKESAKIPKKRNLGIDYERSDNSLNYLLGRDIPVTKNIPDFFRDRISEDTMREHYRHNTDRNIWVIRHDRNCDTATVNWYNNLIYKEKKMKSAKIISAIIAFLLVMAGCILCSTNQAAEELLLRHAVLAGVISACMFMVGIIVLFSTTGSDKENVCNVGQLISLPLLYLGIMGAVLVVFRIAVQRILASEETAPFVLIEPKLLMTALGIVTVVAAGVLIIIFWRTAVEDGILVFTAAVAIAVIIVILGAGVVSELSKKLDDGVVDMNTAKPAVTATLPEPESGEIYGTDF